MDNACFLAPIHPPKFDHGLHFISTYNRFYNDDHIYLAFSSEEDSAAFALLAVGLSYRSIVCCNVNPAAPTLTKKFDALQQIFASTDFVNVGTVDVDTEFFKTVNYSELFDNYNKRGEIYGNDYDFAPWPIVQAPFKYFNETDKTKLWNITSSGRAYFWFNELPVFNKTYFTDFINYTDFNNQIHRAEWFDFDFNLYACYLLVKGLFVLKPLIVNGKLFNCIFIEDQLSVPPEDFKQAFTQARPMWIKQDIDDAVLMSQTFMHVHVDRIEQ